MNAQATDRAEQPIASAHFHATDEDYIAVNLRAIRRSASVKGTYRKNWRASILAGLLVSGMLATILYQTSSSATTGTRRVGIFLFIFWVVGFPLNARGTLTRAAFDKKLRAIAEKITREHRPTADSDDFDVAIYPDQLLVQQPIGQMTRAWSSICAAVEEPDAVYVQGTGGWVFRIPNRAFATTAERQAFCRTVNDLATGEPDPLAVAPT
jgi:hypothetical protein